MRVYLCLSTHARKCTRAWMWIVWDWQVCACMCDSMYVNPPAPHGGISQVNPSHSVSDEKITASETHTETHILYVPQLFSNMLFIFFFSGWIWTETVWTYERMNIFAFAPVTPLLYCPSLYFNVFYLFFCPKFWFHITSYPLFIPHFCFATPHY